MVLANPRSICPLDAAMEIIEGRWKTEIICKLAINKKMRFNEILKTTEGISSRSLTLQLKSLEKDGMVHREVFAESPPRVEYSLTPKGKSILPILGELSKWGQKHLYHNIIEIDE